MMTRWIPWLVIGVGCANGNASSLAAVDENGEPTGTALALNQFQQGQCAALAPEGWQLIAQRPYDWAQLLDADSTMTASWSILPIDRAAEGIYRDQHGDFFSDPATSMQTIANYIVEGLGGEIDVQYVSDPIAISDYYMGRVFQSSTHAGFITYHLYDLTTLGPYVEGQNYIESLYIAVTTRDAWEEIGDAVIQISWSIRCTTQLRPTGGSDSTSGADDGGLGCDEYSQQLETQYFCDQNGDNYLLNPNECDTDYGDGPGCYRALPGGGSPGGGGYELLTPGRCDC